MYNNTNRMRSIELPENLFSNLGQISREKNSSNNSNLLNNESRNFKPKFNNISKKGQIIPEIKDNIPKEENNYPLEQKLVNLSSKQKYRKRLDNMYNEIKNLKPIDTEIDEIIYFNNYVEKGIVVKPRISSLKQFWTEYRLMKNEKNTKKYDNQSLTNFDQLFNQLSQRVEEINRYIDELKEMRTSINNSSLKLEEEKAKLKEEKKEFTSYKKEEEEKIKSEKESLKVNYDRLQTIINDLDKKLTEIDN